MEMNFTKHKIWFKQLVFVFVFFNCFSVFAQTKVITGKVTDAKDNTTVPGVSVRVKGTTNGTTTDADGNFRLSAATGAVLEFTFLGYEFKEQTVGSSEVMNVSLTGSTQNLSEVVVVGFGTRERKDISSAISTVNAADIERITALSPELALQGRAAGVNVTSGGGDPSARPTVRIRGVSTFGSSDPLYVIDGIPLAEGGAGATFDNVNDATRRTGINLYTFINPNDIESMTVLKDASAAAIYGVRAANGVILITTKSGKKGRARVDVDMLTGIQQLPNTYDVLNTQQYTQFYTGVYNANPQIRNNGTIIPIGQADQFGPVWDPTSSKYLGNSPTYNWQDEIINDNAAINNYNVRVSGGADAITYNFAGNYAYNDAPFKSVNSKRYSVSNNTVAKINKYLEAGLNVRLVRENIKHDLGAGTSATSNLDIGKAAPWQPIFDPNNPSGYASLYRLNSPITPSTFDISQRFAEVQFVSIGNPLGASALNTSRNQTQTALGSVYLQVQPITGLKIKGTYSGQQYGNFSKRFNDFDSWQFSETPSNPYDGAPPSQQLPGVFPNGIGTGNSTTTNTVKSFNVDYQRAFAKHNVNITLDASEQNYKWITDGGSTTIPYKTEPLRYYGQSGVGVTSFYALNGIYSLIGYLGRVSYNYNSKYYIEGVIRRDGSSRFDAANRWGTFPSASVSWRVTQEDFMKSILWLNDLKLRAGYGVLGNEQTTGGFKYSPIAGVNPPSYNLGSGLQTNNQGINFPTFPNRLLSWEKKYTTNIGFDAALFDNTVSFTADYFSNETKGIIQQIPILPSAGIQASADVNVGSVLNRGLEFQVGYNKTFGAVGVNLSANFSTVHNEVTSLYNNQANRGGGLEIGQPLGFIYGYKVGGIFQNQEEVTKWKANNTDNTGVVQQKPGDIYFQDINGQPTAGSTDLNSTPDKKIDANDQVYLGSTIPGHTYGFTFGANFKGFDFSAFFSGIGDVQKYNFARAAGESMNGYGRNQWTTVLNAWTPQNQSTTMPRAVYQDPAGNNRFSDRFVESGAYFRFQNLQIGHNFSKKLLDKTKSFQNLRVYLSGMNLFTVTKYTGLDPENDFYPTTRQFLVGVRAGF